MTDILSTISRCRSLLSEGGILFYDAFCVFCFSFFFFWRDCSATAAFISTKSSPTNGRLCSVIRWWWYPDDNRSPIFLRAENVHFWCENLYSASARKRGGILGKRKQLVWLQYQGYPRTHVWGHWAMGISWSVIGPAICRNGNTYSSEVHKQLKVWPFRPCSPFGDFPPVS